MVPIVESPNSTDSCGMKQRSAGWKKEEKKERRGKERKGEERKGKKNRGKSCNHGLKH